VLLGSDADAADAPASWPLPLSLGQLSTITAVHTQAQSAPAPAPHQCSLLCSPLLNAFHLVYEQCAPALPVHRASASEQQPSGDLADASPDGEQQDGAALPPLAPSPAAADMVVVSRRSWSQMQLLQLAAAPQTLPSLQTLLANPMQPAAASPSVPAPHRGRAPLPASSPFAAVDPGQFDPALPGRYVDIVNVLSCFISIVSFSYLYPAYPS
jgi:hypothetical protein